MAEADALRESESVEVSADHPRATVALSVGGEGARSPFWNWTRGGNLTDPRECLCALLPNTDRANLTLLTHRTSPDGIEGIAVPKAEPESSSLYEV